MIKKLYRDFKILGLRKLAGNFLHEGKMFVRRGLKNSFSQNEEDVLIDSFFNNQNLGFFVDIGAFDPSRFSNTKRFYLKGWRGINIEPDPLRIKKFFQTRSGDINLNIGIANEDKVLNFYKFNPGTLSTFSKNTAEEYEKQGFRLVQVIKVPVRKLGNVLREYVKNRKVDFFSIDTEGLDLEVLKSNNWKRFKPKVVCIEGGDNEEKFLLKLGYKKVFQTPTNSIFLR